MRLSRITQAADGIVSAGIAIVTASGQWLYLAQSGRGNQTRAPSLGCTPGTSSPAATSCWASR